MGQFSFAKKEVTPKKNAKAKVTAVKKAGKKDIAKKDSSKKKSSKKDVAKKDAGKSQSKKNKMSTAKKDVKKKTVAKKSGKSDKVASKPSKGKSKVMEYMAENKKVKGKSRSVASQKPFNVEKPKKEVVKKEAVQAETLKPEEFVQAPIETIPVPAPVTEPAPMEAQQKREVAKELDEFEQFNLGNDQGPSEFERPDIKPEE